MGMTPYELNDARAEEVRWARRDIAALRVALLATTKALGLRWYVPPGAAGTFFIDGRARPEVGAALKVLGLPDPCKLSEFPEA